MKKLLTLSLLTMLCCGLVANAEISKEKRQEVEKLLRVTGMEKLVNQMMGQMLSTLKAKIPEVPEAYWIKFQAKVDVRELIEKIMPIYDKYYTVEDLRQLNAFYESPIGQKVLSNLPHITQETMQIGQEWGERIGRQAVEEVEQESKKK